MRSARFHSCFLLLAFAATLLMAVAPVVSRWVQSGHEQHMAVMPSAADAAPAGHHAMTAAEHAMHMAGAAAETHKPPVPADPHAAHGEACEYCTMASRLVLGLALLLVLAPLLYRLAPETPRAIRLPTSLRWPAHPVRGPPLFS